jgi:hypothetical protein
MKKKFEIHWSHLIAVALLAGYFIGSKANAVHAFTKTNSIETFIQLYTFGITFGCMFLYIFSHDKFIPFAREIEKKERQKEGKYLNKYKHHGKVLATFLIGGIGGPVFASLTARLLLNKYGFKKYLVVILANIPSTILSLGIGKGLLGLIQ